VLEHFRAVNRDLQQTIVMVSHESWHLEYFDRVIYLQDGLLDEERIRVEGEI
jgi:putative ABC transport system ATP-binding protein